MKRMSDGKVTVTAVQYFQMDKREGAEYIGIDVLKRQVRYMERIRRLETYLMHLAAITARHLDTGNHARIEALDARFIVAEDALHAHERTQP